MAKFVEMLKFICFLVVLIVGWGVFAWNVIGANVYSKHFPDPQQTSSSVVFDNETTVAAGRVEIDHENPIANSNNNNHPNNNINNNNINKNNHNNINYHHTGHGVSKPGRVTLQDNLINYFDDLPTYLQFMSCLDKYGISMEDGLRLMLELDNDWYRFDKTLEKMRKHNLKFSDGSLLIKKRFNNDWMAFDRILDSFNKHELSLEHGLTLMEKNNKFNNNEWYKFATTLESMHKHGISLENGLPLLDRFNDDDWFGLSLFCASVKQYDISMNYGLILMDKFDNDWAKVIHFLEDREYNSIKYGRKILIRLMFFVLLCVTVYVNIDDLKNVQRDNNGEEGEE